MKKMILPAALLLASCSAPQDDTSPGVTEAERTYGAEQHPHLLVEFVRAYEHDEATYVRRVGVRVAAAAGLKSACTFTLVNAAYDAGGGAAYHFITLASAESEGKAGLDHLFRSFRLLSVDEVARLRPRIIQTVSVQPGDTTERLAGLMADPAPSDLFLMLNGLAAGSRRSTERA
jgi:predicted Zn-dependent protease